MAATIPLPERGQPLDVTYISQLAQAVNELRTVMSPSTNKLVTVDTVNDGPQHLTTNQVRIIGGNVIVTSSETKTAGEEKPFTYSFAGEFRLTPIATATAINVGNTLAGKNVTVVLKSITTSGLDGFVRFNTSGDNVSINVNLIIIGVPN
jgi:hypothetical protein